MDPDELLNRLRVFPNVFFIGSFRPPITFLSQQTRSLNFVWALEQTGFPVAGRTFCILGAGLAGLTAASALRVLGAEVTVIERTTDVLPMQQGNTTRFVLPHLFEWPTPGSAYPRTHLPFLNWNAAVAGDIASEVILQWTRLGLIPETSVDVANVRSPGGQPTVRFSDRPPRTFDVVIITVGFGVEDSQLARHTAPYWRNEDLDQPVISAGEFSCLVSGTGDGGLLDVLRIALSNFRHGEFLQWLLRHDWILDRATEIRNELAAGDPEIEVWQRFIGVAHPPDVESEFRERRRPNTIVVLNGRQETPLEGDALISTKIAIGLLWKLDLIEYRRGTLTNVRHFGRNRFRARVADVADDAVAEWLEFNKVIVRHGPVSILRKLIGPSRFTEMRDAWPDEIQDPTAIPQYNLGYLSNEFMDLNFEVAFEVVFALGSPADRNQPLPVPATPMRVIEALDMLGQQLGIDNLSQRLTADGITPTVPQVTVPWNGMPCTFRFRPGAIRTPRGHCSGPLIVATIEHRALLEQLLDGDPVRYNSYAVRVTPEVLTGHLEPIRDLETAVYVIDRRSDEGRIRVVSHLGMFQAHRLFSVQSLIEILGNRWEVRRVHELGWLIGARGQHIREHWTI